MKSFIKLLIAASLLSNITSVVAADERCHHFTKIPKVVGLDYTKARGVLTANGWRPLRMIASSKDAIGSSEMIEQGFFEVQNCTGTGVQECTFIFIDRFGNFLGVKSEGEGSPAIVDTSLMCLSAEKDWDDRAEGVARLLVNSNQNYIAEQIQSLTHPSGNTPSLVSTVVAKVDDSIVIQMSVTWFGGFTNTAYQTSVAWGFNKSSHIIARVSGDTASFGVKPANAILLNNFFQNNLYPLLRDALVE